MEKLTHLDLSRSMFHYELAKALGENLKNFKYLKALILKNCDIGKRQVEQIFIGMIENNSVSFLDLRMNIVLECTYGIVKMIREKRNFDRLHIDLSHNQVTNEVFSNIRSALLNQLSTKRKRR